MELGSSLRTTGALNCRVTSIVRNGLFILFIEGERGHLIADDYVSSNMNEWWSQPVEKGPGRLASPMCSIGILSPNRIPWLLRDRLGS